MSGDDSKTGDNPCSGSGDYVALPLIDQPTFGNGDFTIDCYVKSGAFDLGKAVPADGRMHDAALTRKAGQFVVHGQEYIDGVLFVFAKHYGRDGRLEVAKYTRADLVKG